jgi:hypothetical protein
MTLTTSAHNTTTRTSAGNQPLTRPRASTPTQIKAAMLANVAGVRQL